MTERIDPELAEALAALPKSAAGVFAAAEDGYIAYQWLREEAIRLGIDKKQIGIAGASGGGCIAAATTLISVIAAIESRSFRLSWDLFAPEARLTAAFFDTWHGYLRRIFGLAGLK